MISTYTALHVGNLLGSSSLCHIEWKTGYQHVQEHFRSVYPLFLWRP